MSVASAASNVVVFEGARLIVDVRKAPIDDAAFLVENGRVVKVGKRGALKIPAGAAHVDLSGKTVMPALLDPHVHLGYQKGITYSAANFTRATFASESGRRYAPTP